jgi:hypothetical protein
MKMRIPRITSVLWTAVGCAALLIAGYAITGCGQGGGTGTGSGMGMVTTAITDPAECSAAAGGTYDHVYVTITDVQANASSSASASGSGWVDMTPGMKPTQVDLLGSAASGGCFLATLGDNLEVQAGTYQQIRLILGSNTSTMVNGTNYCSQNGGLSSAVNCIEYKNHSGADAWSALTTPSAQQTGIKIPAAQIAGGSLVVQPGKTSDLVINFKTCQSIVQAGNSGQFILKPVLNAGEVSTASTSINGTVVDSSGQPITGPNTNVVVSLEQPDGNGVDRVVESTHASNVDGTFVFCPVMPGTYDVVVNADTTTGSAGSTTIASAYNVAVVTGVQPGDTTGKIMLTPATPAPFSTATLTGVATSQVNSTTPAPVYLNFYPLEANPVTGATTKAFTVPLLQNPPALQVATLPAVESTNPSYTDAAGTVTTCPANTACATFSMTVPQSGISVYNYSTSGPTPAATTYSTPLASYQADAIATTASGDPACGTNSELTAAAPAITAGSTSDQPLVVNTTTSTPAVLNFTGCMAQPVQ